MKRLAAILAGALLLTAMLQGCASRNATRVPSAGKRPNFSQRRETVMYLISTGQFRQASSQLKKLEEEARSGAERATVSVAKASFHLARGELVLAEEDASRAIGICPSLAPAYSVRATVRRKRGNLPGAVEDFKSALGLLPNDDYSLRGVAEAYLAEKKTFDAVRALERFLQVDSLDAWAQDSWRDSMGSLLGIDGFPMEYLGALKNGALTRGELAAVLLVEFETAQLELMRDSGLDGRRREELSQPRVHLPDCARFWFAPLAERAVSLGLLDVYPDGTFRPFDTVNRGALALDLYSFLDRHCKDALSGMQDERTLSTVIAKRDASVTYDESGAPILSYSDVDASSYLWRPVVAAVAFGFLEPAYGDSFGVNAPLSGEEVSKAAFGLAEVLFSNKCEASH